MTTDLSHYRFVAKALLNKGARPRELARTMPAHPLSYMELPYDPEYTLYNSRLTPEKLDTATDDEMYWAVRTNVIFRHTGELPIEISGPDAETLLNKVFTRRVGKVKPGRCSYQFACYHDGGMITDGVLLRLSQDRFWMAQADGDLFSWYRAHTEGLDVKIHDPKVWVSQIQGPRSMDLLAAVLDGPMPDPFCYFDCAEVSIAGRTCWISRSGFTNELGWEVYMLPDTDIPAIGDRIMEVGAAPRAIRRIRAVVFASCAWTTPHRVRARRSMCSAPMVPLKDASSAPCRCMTPTDSFRAASLSTSPQAQ